MISTEIIGIVVMISTILVLAFFFMYQQWLKGAEVEKSVSGRIFDESANLATLSLFNDKVEVVEKSYVEAMIDAILENETNKTNAFYGSGIGEVNLTEIIPSLLERYLPGRWELLVITPDGNETYGISPEEKKVIYRTLIPVPEERIGGIVLQIG